MITDQATVIRVLISRTQDQGQVTVEYFILFAVVALLTILGLTRFGDNIKVTLGGFVNAAAKNITK